VLVAFSVAPSGTPQPGTGGSIPGAAGDPATGDAGAGRGAGDSVSAAVAAAVAVVRASGLPHRTDSMFTTIEGDWDECMDVVKRATQAVGAYGSRVSLVLKADIRPGHTGELQGKLDRLETAIGQAANSQAAIGAADE
jgi:uncharacterized protein YqgV (UPF0045/DUF77 family)